jgi:hypothetical protein
MMFLAEKTAHNRRFSAMLAEEYILIDISLFGFIRVRLVFQHE